MLWKARLSARQSDPQHHSHKAREVARAASVVYNVGMADNNRNLWGQPPPKKADAIMLLLSGGMIATGLIGLLLGKAAGLAAVVIGAVWLLIERRKS